MKLIEQMPRTSFKNSWCFFLLSSIILPSSACIANDESKACSLLRKLSSEQYFLIEQTERLMIVSKDSRVTVSDSGFMRLKGAMDVIKIDVVEIDTGDKIGSLEYRSQGRNISLGEFSVKREGFATEAKFSLMKIAFEKVGVTHVNAMIHLPNEASEKLHKKLGFVLQKPSALFEGVAIYKISKEDFIELKKRVAQAGGILEFSKNRGI